MPSITYSSIRAAMVAAALTVACSGGKAQLNPEILVLQEDPAGATPLTRPTFVVADNQQQHLYGKSVWIRTALVDKYVGSAIRAPQLDLFGPSVLEWVVDTYSAQGPFIHLGDGLNLSCKQEFAAFSRTMAKTEGGWFMAPGNHDGIYFGSSGSNTEWKDVCASSGLPGEESGPMDKAEVVQAYMDAAFGGDNPAGAGVKAFEAWRKANANAHEWKYSGTERHWLERVAWRIAKDPYQSFILQQLDVTLQPEQHPRVKYILLDTSDYKHSPELIPVPPHVNAGSTGNISQKQLEILERWLEELHAGQDGARPPVVVLMGHHPFDDLRKKAREELDRLRNDYGVLLYVSAHTHHGGYFMHDTGKSGWLELNLGSLVDWPLEFRVFNVREFQKEGEGAPRFFTHAELHDLYDELANFDCDSKWQPRLGDGDYYVDYQKAIDKDQERMAALVFDSLLTSYQRLLGYFPSAPDNTKWPAFGTPPIQSDEDVLRNVARVKTLGTDIVVKDEQTASQLRKAVDEKRRFLAALEIFDRERTLTYRPDGVAKMPSSTTATPSVAAVATVAEGEVPSSSESGTEAPPEAAASAPPVSSAAPPASVAAPEPEPPPADAVSPAERHQAYRRCQAFWASMDDQTGARRARREDWFVAYPPQKER